MKHVIIGNGIAGISAAETLRELDPRAPITIVGAEEHLPYSRPMISLVLSGEMRFDEIAIRPADFYSRFQLEPVIGERVVSLDVAKREIHTDKGKAIAFDRLLIASGATPKPVNTPGVDLENVFYMRTQSDVASILRALPRAKSAVILGGGLVAYKAAYGLLHRGVKTTMVVRSAHPLSMVVDPFAGQRILETLQQNGIDVRVRCDVEAFDGNGQVNEASLTDGSRIQCDLAIVAKGVQPSLSFLSSSDIRINQGIVVDEHLETTVPGIFAAGDVAEAMDVARQKPAVNAIWPVAVEQGRIAAMNMAGREVIYKGSIARNVMRVFDVDVLTGGLVNVGSEEYEVVVRQDWRRRSYHKIVFRGDVLVGLVMVNAVEQGGLLLSLIQHQAPVRVPKELLLEPSFNIGQLLL